MIDCGPALFGTPGANVKDEHDLDRRLQMQTLSQGPERQSGEQTSLDDRIGVLRPATTKLVARPGTSLLSAAGWDTSDMPAAAQSTNVGGMGAHWTCACPWPNQDELGGDWTAERDTVQRIFHITQQAVDDAPVVDKVRSALQDVFAAGASEARAVQNMPMAVNQTTEGRSWTGSATVLGPLLDEDDSTFRIVPDSLCTRVLMDGATATGVQVRGASGTLTNYRAAAVVVACDSFRTPQLLWASGVRPQALGRGLNEHMMVTSTIRLGNDGAALRSLPGGETDPVMGSLWIPYLGHERSFHGQITILDLQRAGRAENDRFLVGLSWFIPSQISMRNRVTFSGVSRDYLGLPAGRIQLSRTEADRAALDAAIEQQRHVSTVLGAFVGGGPTIPPAGRSLHYTGTVRMGNDPEVSVCDSESRVWGTNNLYVAGNGVIPTSVAANTTATSAMIAARGAGALARAL
jgi:choline dehydrogenase-like flavoprotein